MAGFTWEGQDMAKNKRRVSMTKKKKPPTEKELRKAAGVIADGVLAHTQEFLFPGVFSIKDEKGVPLLECPISDTASAWPVLQIFYRRWKGDPVLSMSHNFKTLAPGIVLTPGKRFTMEFHVQK